MVLVTLNLYPSSIAPNLPSKMVSYLQTSSWNSSGTVSLQTGQVVGTGLHSSPTFKDEA